MYLPFLVHVVRTQDEDTRLANLLYNIVNDSYHIVQEISRSFSSLTETLYPITPSPHIPHYIP